jgi:hypothetical protein
MEMETQCDRCREDGTSKVDYPHLSLIMVPSVLKLLAGNLGSSCSVLGHDMIRKGGENILV